MADLISMLAAASGVGGINPREHFNTVLYTGTDTPRSITGVGFQPDFVWIKARSVAYSNILYDVLRGTGGSKSLVSNLTSGEGNLSTLNNLSSYDSDGFSIGAPSSGPDLINRGSETFVAWNWKANGAGSSNTAGTISSTVSVNTTSGFSIVRWDGNGAGAAATIGHGLGAVPKMIINKGLDFASAWSVYHASAGNTVRLTLNTTDAVDTNSGFWNNTTPTSSVFTVGNIINQATPYDYVAYCFAEVEGFSKFGSYTGNGSATGPSVTTDFQVTWLMIKRTDTTGDWILLDSARDATNPRTEYLEPNTSDAEATGNDVDFNSTGFQLKSTSASVNANGGTYIYACFA